MIKFALSTFIKSKLNHDCFPEKSPKIFLNPENPPKLFKKSYPVEHQQIAASDGVENVFNYIKNQIEEKCLWFDTL